MNPSRIRRYIHSIAETGFAEKETSSYIKSMLDRFGCDIICVGETGKAAFFNFGFETSIILRAELDALPIKEKTGLPFASVNGSMHACGHDGHMAMLLCVAEKLSLGFKARKNVLLVFQPAEELTGGAESFISYGIIKRFNANEAYAMHIRNGLSEGVLFSKSGVITAGSSEIDIIAPDTCSHAEYGGGTLVYTARFITETLDELASSEFSGSSRLSFGKITAGTARNTVGGGCVLLGTLRYLCEKTKSALTCMLKKHAHERGLYISLRDYAPPVVNGNTLYESLRAKIPLRTLPVPVFSADDFSLYRTSGCDILYMFLGAGDSPPLHSERFDFNEDILTKGIDAYMKILQ